MSPNNKTHIGLKIIFWFDVLLVCFNVGVIAAKKYYGTLDKFDISMLALAVTAGSCYMCSLTLKQFPWKEESAK